VSNSVSDKKSSQIKMIDDPDMNTIDLPSIQHGGAETSMVLEELPENEYDSSARGDDEKSKGSIFAGEKADKSMKDGDNGVRYSNLN